MSWLIWLIKHLVEFCCTLLQRSRVPDALVWLFKHLSKAAYWLRCHTLTRYHLLDMRDRGEGHGYKWGWCDRDHLMLLACFAVLRDFVEEESPDVGLVNEEAYYGVDHIWQEGEHEAVRQQIEDEQQLRELYDWWIRGRSEEHAAVEALIADTTGFEGTDIVNHPNFDEWTRRHGELEVRDDAQLLRLIRLRGSLWT